MIRFKKLSLRRGSKLLFEKADLSIFPKQKVGLTGANGCGKSSLFSLLLGQLQADNGDAEYPKNWQIAHVKQETPALSQTALNYVLDGDAEFRQIEAQLEQATQSEQHQKLAELYADMERIDGYSAAARAGRLMSGLGFTADQENQAVKSFSGGWRMRLNLAQALMCRSDLLLLDEPTNHLDLEAVIWLQDWLKRYQGTLLLISHDRDFLDQVTEQTIHIEKQQMSLYSGNYTAFETIRAERLSLQQAQFEKQQKRMAHMQSYIDRFRYKANKAKQAQSRLKAMQRMEKISQVQTDNPFSFKFLTPARQRQHQIVQIEQATISYGDKHIFQNMSFNIEAGARIGLLGRNGTGKSTLIKAICGQKQLAKGTIKIAKDLQIGYFAQHQVEQLDPQATALEQLLQLDPNTTEQQAKNFLGGFDFRGEQLTTHIAPFSGGEKSRLALALLVYRQPDLLLLDEPTNHLDLNMRHAIALALQDYQGALMLVSHDKHLIDSVIDNLYLIDQQQIGEFNGDLNDYQQFINQQLSQDKKTNQPNKQQTKHQVQHQKAQKNRLQKLEKQIDQLHQKQQQLNQQLSDEQLYQAENADQLQQLLQQSKQLQQQITQTETEWLELSD